MLSEIKLIEDFKSVITGLSELNEETIKNCFLQKLHEFKNDIVSDIMDQNKFSRIANDIFINDIYPHLKNNQLPSKSEISISSILKEFPESRGILKKILLHISTDGDYDSDLGSIVAETEELDRFRITLFLGSLFAIISSDTFHPKHKFRSLSKSEKDDFMKYILGILIHELTHLIDYFRYTREELFKRFQKILSTTGWRKESFCRRIFIPFCC